MLPYLTHFAGRTATPVTAFGPPVADWPHAWERLGHALGLPAAARQGQSVRLRGEEGVVYFVNAQNTAVRTASGLYRFIRGFRGPMIASHHLFTPQLDEFAWQGWLAEEIR
ncbi:hypothetical protein OIE66_18800 [Nonomuraea sp. NBC_01738]|uniref:hypothetical protein n=1 Tax=Nonomuraea sp. NBC_01738 TaxID=2976003 RepID=UPI002E12C035|nr:hypothetical protein OIE66_18800 [Nonomuraea sp. NBC_01738]